MQTMETTDVQKVLDAQQAYFYSGETKSTDFRLRQLNTLEQAIKAYEDRIIEAMKADLGKPSFEAYLTEIGVLLMSLKDMKKKLPKWAEPKKVKGTIMQVGSKSMIYPEPYGTVLVIGPFNYPFQLLIEPLLGAIAAGNTAVLKPSEFTPNVAAVVRDMIAEYFDPAYITVVEGEKETTSALIHAPFDYMFFTGSTPVGKIVMEAASKNLTPVTLELGGKSPAIVDEDADLDKAAEKIIWGKCMNNGQTCIAPDYVLVAEEMQTALVARLKTKIRHFYGDNPQVSPDLGRVVNDKHWQRLEKLLDPEKVVHGGSTDQTDLYIEPTLMTGVTMEDAVMQEEVFGPILPILTYRNLHEAVNIVRSFDKPLALYLFTNNPTVEEHILSTLSFGGGSVNDTILHLANPNLPFGGVGNSGIGAYHGKASFDTFTHYKSILKNKSRFSPSVMYPPYKESRLNAVRKWFSK
ncbi:aldehyde dehydrogenase [Sinobaca sp. H24]|uniref:aldehyde dehydrogenase n=1 Tax=Sinobaca sp. H24 TaxID=2923376 RepID=UPI00207A485C|nr:aldehyde dehydrogenase [Sinobaca sp. H24]